MGPGLRASLAAAVLTASACGNSFSSTPLDAGSADVSTADVGTSDAGSDSGPTDSSSGGGDSSPGEAGLNDGPIGDGGPVLSYCAQHVGTYDFCEDFDKFPNVTEFLGSWTTFSSTGGTFTFDQSNVPSPPNALGIATTSTTGVRALVVRAMPAALAPVAKQRLEFDFLVNDASNIGFASAGAVAAILFGGDVNGGAVALAFGNGTGSTATVSAIYQGPLPDAGIPLFGSANAPPPFPPLGQWDGRFAIEIDYPSPDAGTTTGATACVQLYIGGIAQLTPCLTLPSALSRPAAMTSIALGVYSGGAQDTGDIGVAFDNVTFVGR
jgi:hypothetical protein